VSALAASFAANCVLSGALAGLLWMICANNQEIARNEARIKVLHERLANRGAR
jgi:hypothetical protein